MTKKTVRVLKPKVEPPKYPVRGKKEEEMCRFCRFFINILKNDFAECCRYPTPERKNEGNWCGEFQDHKEKA